MASNDDAPDSCVGATDPRTTASPRTRSWRRAAAVVGVAALAVPLSGCFGAVVPSTSSMAVSCTTVDVLSGDTIGTFDTDLEVGLSGPTWTHPDEVIPFRDAALSGIGTPGDPTVLAFSLDGASPDSLQFGRNAADDGFDNVLERQVTAAPGSDVVASLASVLVIHLDEAVTYDLCTPASGADAAVVAVPVQAVPTTTP